jgi:coenzyme PQQ precursor peptide PqqA
VTSPKVGDITQMPEAPSRIPFGRKWMLRCGLHLSGSGLVRWHIPCATTARALMLVDHCSPRRNGKMTWTKPEFAVVELGMEVGAYAGNA